MEKRQPYNLRKVMMIYNLYQVMYNGCLVTMFIINRDAQKYLIAHTCKPVPYTENPFNNEFYFASWAYLFSKIGDLLDTVFMVLKKKNSHITFLHVYHHTAMVSATWTCIKYIRAEQGVLPCTLNCAVHVIMYAYYFLAALGPEVQKYLWWKRYLTKIQIGQFIIVMGYLGLLYLNKCEVSQVYNVFWICNVFVILCLFLNFYIKTYLKSNRSKEVINKSD
ncbi:very long chain fatty acid elongase 7-like [Lycorma delicatula]|uniref:very long chain fatty acid elongase 7-like n=1 Tax=Lycorma delicatula TaxID=130591 RepID=UPI003F516DB1